MTSDVEVEERLASSLEWHADRLGSPPGGGLRDVRRRLVRRRRAGAAVLGGATLTVGVAATAWLVGRPSDQSSVSPEVTEPQTSGSGEATTVDVTTPDATHPADQVVPLLWPGYIPAGAFVEDIDLTHDESYPGKTPIAGLVGRLEADGSYLPVKVEIAQEDIQDPGDQDQPVALANGTTAFMIEPLDGPRVLRFEQNGQWFYLSGWLPPAELADLATQFVVGAGPEVTLAPSSTWKVLEPIVDHTGRRLSVISFEHRDSTFVVTVSWTPPELPLPEESRVTIESSDQGVIGHVGRWSYLARNDGLWITVGEASPLGISHDDALQVLLSMRPATPDEVSSFPTWTEQPDDVDSLRCESRSIDESGVYVIQIGDYLNLIAHCFGVSLDDLRAMNPAPRQFIPGATLVIPTTVQEG